MEDPTRIFATLEERFPEAGDSDTANTAVRAVISLVPYLGGPINEVLSQVLVPALSRRKDEWLKEMARIVHQISQQQANFRFEDLANHEQFISAAVEASRIAIGTHQKEKRAFLRNILVRIGTNCTVSEDLQFMYLRLVDDFTPTHIRILDFLWRGNREFARNHGQLSIPRRFSEVLEILFPEFIGKSDLVDRILTDLRSRGLCTLQSITLSFPQQVMTNHGIEFLNFILSPDELK